MKKIYMFAALMLLTGLSACRAKDEPVLTGILFDRGHGSMWGNQLYIEVRRNEIVTAGFISERTGDWETREHIPITEDQWKALEAAVLKLELQEETVSWKDRLFGGTVLDGGEYRHLSLVRGKEECKYRWPNSEEARALEALLEQLAKATE